MPWWEILGVAQSSPLTVITAAFRHLAKTAHPDAGGNRAAWDRIAGAYEAAKRELADR